MTILAFKTNMAGIIIGVFFDLKQATQGLQDRWTPKLELVKETIYTIKVLCSGLKAAAVNSCFLISLIYLMVKGAFLMI